MWQSYGGQMAESGMNSAMSAVTTAAGSYAGWRMGKMADKKAFERQVMMMQNAHQWEVEDLRKAGLNPILSAGGSGAHASPVSNTTASSAMSGADVGSKLAREMAMLNVKEVQARINAVNATTAREMATVQETKERTKAEYGERKMVGNSKVRMKDGTEIEVPEYVNKPGRVQLQKQQLEFQNALMGVDAAKQQRLYEVLMKNPKLLDAYLMIDTARDVSNSARSVSGLITDWIPGNKAGSGGKK